MPGADFIIKKHRFPRIVTQRRFLYNEYLAQQSVMLLKIFVSQVKIIEVENGIS